jgi:hypothetical protein
MLTNFIEPDSILTSMYLYSENKLCALVLLVDACVSQDSYSILPATTVEFSDKKNSRSENNVTRRFAHICNRNGYDFHFQSIEHQLESIVGCVRRSDESSAVSAVATTTTTAASQLNDATTTVAAARINIGDFYTTKHSNLSKAHVVYHLAAYNSEDLASVSLKQSLKKSELSSRHPVILGLRNILKSCFMNNVQTLTFPLLLTHQMTEVSVVFFSVGTRSNSV